MKVKTLKQEARKLGQVLSDRGGRLRIQFSGPSAAKRFIDRISQRAPHVDGSISDAGGGVIVTVELASLRK